MLRSTWNFLKRHKKKCIFLGTVLGGGWQRSWQGALEEGGGRGVSVFKNRCGETTAQDSINHETGNGVPNLQGSLKKESEVTQSCPILCDPMDCSLPGSSIHGNFPGKSTGVVCHFLLQGSLHLCNCEMCALCPGTAPYSVFRLFLTAFGITHLSVWAVGVVGGCLFLGFFSLSLSLIFLFQDTVLLHIFFLFSSLVFPWNSSVCHSQDLIWHSSFAKVSQYWRRVN